VTEITIGIAFLAGIASFFSPCCLPLVPSYLAYLSGVSITHLRISPHTRVRFIVVGHALAFMVGFSLLYYVLGASAWWFATWFQAYQQTIAQLAGILLIVMGLVTTGVWKPQLLMRTWKWDITRFVPKASLFGSAVFGLGFAAGWSPCIGPSLATIVALAATNPNEWAWLTTAYTIGFGLPFVTMAFFLGAGKRNMRHMARVQRFGGIVLIAFGVLLLTGQMTSLTAWLVRLTPQSWLL
jgi:cytochrome c-type biogenesis protein